jgi:AP2 domain-containing protein
MSAVIFIPLTQGKVTVIDFEDFEAVRGLPCCAWRHTHRKTWYAFVFVNNKNVKLCNYLLAPWRGCVIDHIDGDGLHNCRGNLRYASDRQNKQAFRTKSAGKTSQYRGVRLHRSQRWTAQLTTSGEQVYLGIFDSPDDAARAYDAAALRHFGEFASLNFPRNKNLTEQTLCLTLQT